MMRTFFIAVNSHLKCLFNTLVWVIFQIYSENFRNYLSKTIRDRKLVVLATGPSLNDDLSVNNMLDSDFCVVNEYCKSSMYKELKPTMYVLADPLYFCEEWMRDSDKETIDIISKTDWNVAVYVPYIYFSKVKIKLQSNFVHVYSYHTNTYLGWDFMRNILYKKGWSMPRIQNVLIPCVFIGINLGYSVIELYGVDHSWTKEIRVNKENQVCLCDRHFYDKGEVALNPWKRFDGNQYKMHEILRDLAYMFEGYHNLRKYADMNNCKVRNMTKESFIDAFERKQ